MGFGAVSYTHLACTEVQRLSKREVRKLNKRLVIWLTLVLSFVWEVGSVTLYMTMIRALNTDLVILVIIFCTSSIIDLNIWCMVEESGR